MTTDTEKTVTRIRECLTNTDDMHAEAARLMVDLEGQHWTQRRIAEAVSCSQKTVSYHLRWIKTPEPRVHYSDWKRMADSPRESGSQGLADSPRESQNAPDEVEPPSACEIGKPFDRLERDLAVFLIDAEKALRVGRTPSKAAAKRLAKLFEEAKTLTQGVITWPS